MASSNDIFISYAWADNEPPAGALAPEKDRWVWQFERALTAALRSKLGAPLNVWIDRRKLRANSLIEGMLTEELRRSRLLVVLMSPSWSASSWCRLELETYLAQHPGTKTQESVFVVEIEPVPRATWNERIRELAAFTFHKPLANGRGSVRLGYPLPDPRLDRDFYLDVVTLADDIAAALEAPLAQPAVSESPGPVEPAASSASSASSPSSASSAPPGSPEAAVPEARPRERVVWIAEPTDDLQRRRRELQDAIRQAGFDVVSPSLDAMLRAGGAPIERQLEQGLSTAGLFVQLLGPHAGRMMEDGRSWAQLQSELAHAVAAREGWPFIAWRAIGTSFDEAEEPHRLLLNAAVEQGFEELRRDLIRRLPAQRTLPAAPQLGTPARPSICITCSEEDTKLGDEVMRMLDDLDVFYLEFVDGAGGEESLPDRAEDKALSESTGVVIVYGAADANWLVSKVQRANQLRGRGERLWGALIDAPVAGKRPAPRARAIERHDWSGGPDFEHMRRFVETIGFAGGGAHV